MTIKQIWQKFLLLIFPKYITCNGCGKELKQHSEMSLCTACLDQLTAIKQPEQYDNIQVFSCYEYKLLTRKMVIAYKDGNKPYLSEYMAKAMAEMFNNSGIDCDIVCFVPTDKQSAKKRGYDAMKNVANFFCELSGLTMLQQITRIRHIKDQTQLNIEQRRRYILDNFEVKDNAYWGKTVLILDDLVASGATLNECGRVLKQKGGASAVIALTFAKAV